MKICYAQINPTVGDIEGNKEKVIYSINEAKKRSTDLILFPELVIIGYPPKDLILKKKFVKENERAVEEIKEHCNNIVALISFVESQEDMLYNTAVLIKDKEVIGFQRKTHLPNYDVFDEKRYFKKAEEHNVFDLLNRKIGIAICEDIWLDGPVEELKKKGADLILSVSASPYVKGKEKTREKEVLRKRALKNKIDMVYCNLVGGQDDLIFDGHSVFMDKNGKKRFETPSFEEGLYYYDTKGPDKILEPVNDIEMVYRALILGIKDYLAKNGFRKAVIGLSGGIDSALTAALAVEALGKENVLGITMPSKYSSKGSVDDSQVLAKNLGITMKNIPIKEIFASYISILSEEFKGTGENVAEENIQARIRGNILMAMSNKFGYLVLSTGNKSELAVGYCTLYGDMSGGLAVISDVPKTMVYEISRLYNKLKGKEIIPKAIIEKAPSAELRLDQKDSDSLPDYDILDQIFDLYVEKGLDKEEVLEKSFDKQTVEKVIRLIRLNEYKRKQAPLGLKVTSKAFGSGRRIPITNKWDE